MKKVLKNRIFIVIITMIICISGTLYATTKYNASEILYNAGDGTSINVNEALNNLYKKSNDELCSSLCGNVTAQVGDYVRMTPTSTSYTISKDLTGYSSDITINPSELNLWRIIKINDDGTIEMVSQYVSSTNIIFQELKGYLNYVGVLNLAASQYENSDYTIGSRIIGYGGQTEYITDTSIFTHPATLKKTTSDNSNESTGGGDMMYEDDTNLVEKVLGTLVAKNPSGTATVYWLGSRSYIYDTSSNYYWGGRRVHTNGSILMNNYFYYYHTNILYTSNGSYAVRPILTLKPGLTATGRGTSDDPWVLE